MADYREHFKPDRRRFLFAAAALGGYALLPGCGRAEKPDAGDDEGQSADAAAGKFGTVIGPGRALDRDSGETRYFIGMVDLDADTPAYRHMDDIHFFGHGISLNPKRPGTAVVFEKWGKGCAEVDLRAGKSLRKIETVPSRQFYGHGAWTPDGGTLFATETEVGDNSYHGVVAIRDGDSLELKGEFLTYGVAPHDCILVDDGRTLVVTNGGGQLDRDDELPSITYVDVASQSLKQELKFPTKRINAGHIDITSRGELVCVSAPRDGLDESSPGSISFYRPGGEVRTVIDHPVRPSMKAETLSVAIHEPSMVVGATNPAGNLVTFWDFETGKLVHKLEEFGTPRGISLSLDNRYFVLTFEVSMALIDAETLKVVETFESEPTYISGSHNITCDLPA